MRITYNKKIISTQQPSLKKHSIRGNLPNISGSFSIRHLSGNKTLTIKNSIRGISLLSFFDKRFKKSYNGSMTVEAAMVLPLFLFFFLNLLWIIEIYSLHGTLLSALRETGRELSIYAHAYDAIVNEEEDSGLEAIVENIAFSYLYVKQRVENLAGKEYLENSPLTNGAASLWYTECSILQQGDIIDLLVTYQASPFINVVGFRPARFYSRYYGRAWTGYDVEKEEKYVYVAENAEVYHLDRECTHIRLSIRECSLAEAGEWRNEFGSRYTACEKCVTNETEKVYITEDGNRYHQKLECGGLKRTIIQMPRAEAEKQFRMCTRCGR